MLIALYLIGFYFGDVAGRVDEAEMQTMLRALEALPEQAEEILAPENIDRIKAIAAEYKDAKDLFYIGRRMGLGRCSGRRAEAQGNFLHPR